MENFKTLHPTISDNLYTKMLEATGMTQYMPGEAVAKYEQAVSDYHNQQRQQRDPKGETDPNGLNAKTPGAKLDAGKSPVFRGLLDYFPRACLAVANVSKRGAEKYSWKGFAEVEDAVNRYADAGARHILYEAIEGDRDSETGLLHKAQKAWNALAELEMFLRERDGQE